MTASFEVFDPARKVVSAMMVGLFLGSACLPGVPAPVATFVTNSVPISSQITNPPLVPSGSENGAFTLLDLHANIETIGVVVSGVDLPKTAELMYRQSGEANWRTGHLLMRIDDGRLVGSLFGLSPATSYEIRVLDGSNEISSATTTQPNELQFTPLTVLHVDDNASPGGDGSAATPFQTIQEGVNRATPGTQVLVANGVYHE